MNYYDGAPDKIVSVLGTNYGIYIDVPEREDKVLEGCSGYCDKTIKRISIMDLSGDRCNLVDKEEYRKYLIRHELVHAFLFESGIGADTLWDIAGQEHPEHMVEWIAMQFPKLVKVFEQAGAL